MPKAPSIEELLKKPSDASGGSSNAPAAAPAQGAKPVLPAKPGAKVAARKEPTTEEKLEVKMEQIRLVNLEKIAQAEAAKHNLPYVNLNGFPITPEALGFIPRDEARAKKIVCFLQIGDELIQFQNPFTAFLYA